MAPMDQTVQIHEVPPSISISSDLERCTYQSSDPGGYTYQSSDHEEGTYQSSDPEGCTYQSRNLEGHRACKCERKRLRWLDEQGDQLGKLASLRRKIGSGMEMEESATRLTEGSNDRRMTVLQGEMMSNDRSGLPVFTTVMAEEGEEKGWRRAAAM
ncbi:NBS-LRR type resistance protein [Cucumis melo var. makuwa]|uniref:NBS-LRR type resistance protein n=1 Tax=Cucumis melo var. makuwa TaxID=1194695 RepID=A0A5A7SNL1_CUCMM|nr:NBS-LRR type resistance protein [Cucumis melo var. makuwa]TYK30342.1 NBS-LRR type resistance protein [Cucumis melo var. makuwa]